MRAILGAEYNMPIISIAATIRLAVGLNVMMERTRAAALVEMIKVQACLFDTKPEGIGLFFPLALSRSESTRSFNTNMPTVIRKEITGNGNIFWTVDRTLASVDIMPNIPGIKKSPVTVAKE